MAIRPILGGPGVSDERAWSHKYVFRDGKFDKLPNGAWIDATKSRDVWAAASATAQAGGEVLQPGLFMGQVGTFQNFANSFFAALTAAVAHGATTINVGTYQAAEIVRREGSTGTLLIVGPPVANGPAQVGKLTYSAVNTGTGAVTVTATGQNEVQTLNIAGTVSGGTFRIGFVQADNTIAWTGTIAHNGTFGTVITNANTALDAFTNNAGEIVASGAGYTAIALTFTLDSQALRNTKLVVVDISALTGATSVAVTETTPGYFGTFVAGSLIGSTDGSFYPKSMIPPGYGIQVADGANTAIGGVVPWATVPIAGMPEFGQCTPTVTDLGIRRWIAEQMSGLAPSTVGVSGSSSVGGKFVFPDFYNAT